MTVDLPTSTASESAVVVGVTEMGAGELAGVTIAAGVGTGAAMGGSVPELTIGVGKGVLLPPVVDNIDRINQKIGIIRTTKAIEAPTAVPQGVARMPVKGFCLGT